MDPVVTMPLAEASIDDLRLNAAQRRTYPRRQSRLTATENTITLRLALPSEQHQVARLAALDSAKTPANPVILALVNREPLAAISLNDGAVVADPFHRTAELVELLHTPAGHTTCK